MTDIVDEQLYDDLLAAGLEPDDAKHLMYAVHNGYQRFLTLDKKILNRRDDLEKRCPSIRIQQPSKLTSELSITPGCQTGPTERQSTTEPRAGPDRS